MLAELESQTATRDVHAIIYWKINKLLQNIIYYKAFYLRQYLRRGEAVLRKHFNKIERGDPPKTEKIEKKFTAPKKMKGGTLCSNLGFRVSEVFVQLNQVNKNFLAFESVFKKKRL